MTQLEPVLRELKQLKRLQLRKIGMSVTSLPVLTSVLHSCSVLVELNIRDNDFRHAGREAEAFVQALNSHSSLCAVHMPEEKLVDPELVAAMIAVAKTSSRLDVYFVKVT